MACAIRVKICGINSAMALEAAVHAGADWVGFVFFPPSPRYVTPEQAGGLSVRMPALKRWATPRLVGLFVAPTDQDIADALAAVRLDVLQLYTDADRAAAVRQQFGLPVWRAVGVGTRADLPSAMEGADALVIEPKASAGATRPGGNAQRFDWSLLRDWRAPGPWLLAGGLSPANVGTAIAATGAVAVDVSSGVERTPGRKDPELIRAFVAAVRAGSDQALPKADSFPLEHDHLLR